MQILIAVGGTADSQIVLAQAAWLAEQRACSVTLLTAIKDEQERAAGSAVLQAAAATLAPIVPAPQLEIRIGQPSDAIVHEAAARPYDLLLMGSQPSHGLLARLLGPTTLRVIAQISCPILVAKGRSGHLGRVLLCDSAFATPNLLARLTEHFPLLLDVADEVTVLHVMSQISAAPDVADSQLHAGALELIRKETPEGEALAHDLSELAQSDLVARPKVRHGLVVEEILAEATDGRYDLIVIGAHPRQGWPGILLADLAGQIVLKTDRPILVIP